MAHAWQHPHRDKGKRKASCPTYRVGRGREGHDGHVGEVFPQDPELQVVRPEVVPPAGIKLSIVDIIVLIIIVSIIIVLIIIALIRARWHGLIRLGRRVSLHS